LAAARARLEELKGVAALADEVADLQRRHDRYGEDEEELRLAQLTTVAKLEVLKRADLAATARVDEVVRRLDELNAVVTTIGDRVDELGRRLDEVAGGAAALADELHAPPYLSDPGLLAVTLPDGRTAVGFDQTSGLGRAGYRSFEDAMRGSEAMIRSRQRPYLRWLEPGERAIDLGCGRGEMLELFREHGVDGLGIDVDDSMIERCKAKGLEVLQVDALEWLGDQPDACADVIISAQFVEHLPVATLPALFVQARRLLRPGGRFITETVNPHCMPALRTFWVDLTHRHPLFPEAVLIYLHEAGFAAAHVEYPCFEGPGDPRTGAGEYAAVAFVTAPPAPQDP
jgi:SAM-dependent methyltransferase